MHQRPGSSGDTPRPAEGLGRGRREFLSHALLSSGGLLLGSSLAAAARPGLSAITPTSGSAAGGEPAKFFPPARSFAAKAPRPIMDSNWWPVAGQPDLGEYTSPKQQPVDFGVWQAADGSWQLWSCIRGSNFPGKQVGNRFTNRLLYGWEGKSLTASNWAPVGIKWVAQPNLGETVGGMQAPHVIRENGIYHMFYGDWKRICLAGSPDGKHFERVLGGNGQPDLFAEHHSLVDHDLQDSSRARDPMVIKRGNTYYCYYTSHLIEPYNSCWAFCRTSLNLRDWSESVPVSRTPPIPGSDPKYSDECPHVIYLPEHRLYYLFVTQLYGKQAQTTVYASPHPLYFGVDDDRLKVCTLPIAAPEIVQQGDEYFLFYLNPALDGIRATRLRFG